MSKSNLRKQKNKSKLQAVFDKGTKFVSNNFVAFFLLSESEEIPSSTIIVTKKIGNAIKRNRSKRRLREIIRLHIQPETKAIKLIFLARGDTSKSEYSSLLRDCHNLVKKINQQKLLSNH